MGDGWACRRRGLPCMLVIAEAALVADLITALLFILVTAEAALAANLIMGLIFKNLERNLEHLGVFFLCFVCLLQMSCADLSGEALCGSIFGIMGKVGVNASPPTPSNPTKVPNPRLQN